MLRRAAAVVSALALVSAAPVFGAGPSPISQEWESRVRRDLESLEYEVTAVDGHWQAPNRAQNLRVRFRDEAVEITPRSEEPREPWRWQTIGWGREGSMRTPLPAPPTARGNRVEYHAGDFVEWYENRKEGLEQGFTISSRPPGDGALAIEGRIPRGFTMRPDATGGWIDFLDERGASVLRYGKLIAYDARGAWLPSRLEPAGNSLRIVVDDRAALYPITIDPVMTAPAWITESNFTYGYFGYSVATAGDVNGDGYSEVIVGAINYDNGQFEEGRVFLYMGSAAGLDTIADWTGEGNQAIARYGSSIGPAGDVNGDGFGDVIIGADQYDDGERDEGRVYVYLGSASGLADMPVWTKDGEQIDCFLGYTVALAGDVNGDGYDDVVVGAVSYDNDEQDEGRAWVYLGSASGPATSPTWIGEGNQPSAFFSRSIACAGDVNGDGFGDLIAGAPGFTNDEASEGRATVYLGSAAGLATSPVWTVDGEQVGAQFGRSVFTAGDVNGDGYADVIVGAPGFTNGQSGEGRSFIYLGSAAGLSLAPAWTAESDDPGGQFGRSAATAGDVNGDGFADVIVGAYLYGVTTSKGRAYVYLGGQTGLALAPVWTVESDQNDGAYGQAVAAAGDVNGDGFGDVIVGAPLYSNGHTNEGRAFVYLGSGAGPAAAAEWTGESHQVNAYLGYSVASAGDVNGDGFSDVLASAIYFDNGETDEGRVFLFLGSASGLDTTAAWTAESDQMNGRFGTSVASAGDVNGDGYGDVIIGAHQYDNGQVDEGGAFLYLGSAAGLAGTPAWTGEGDQDYARFGISVASAGDVNGDGYGDVIVGAFYYHHEEFEEGRAFVYLGSSAGLALSPAWTAESDQALAFFGCSVASAGDVNGDGFSDVIIGAYGYDNSQSGEGRAYVYYGSASGLPTLPNWKGEIDQTMAYFGISVAGAGDVNGDGYSDVIVGAHQYDGGETDEGGAFVYLGSAGGLELDPAWSADSDQASAAFGCWVGGAGDVNGDGYSDVVVGARAFDNGQSDEGRAFVFLGSAGGPADTAAWTGEVNQAFANFGYSVGGSGDVNGDGFSDVLVGAPYYENGQTDEGRAFVYYGNGGRCLDRRARQAQADGDAPIALLGQSESGGFRLLALGRSAAGRGRVRAEWEAKALGASFDGVATAGGSLQTGVPVEGVGSAVGLSELVSGLLLDTAYHWRLRIATDSPFFPHSPWLSLAGNGADETDLRTGSVPTAVGGPEGVEGGLRFAMVRPNPSSAELAITYVLPVAGPVRLEVHDIQGRRLATVVDLGAQAAGAHSVVWSGRDDAGRIVCSGFYWLRLSSRGEVTSRKLVRL